MHLNRQVSFKSSQLIFSWNLKWVLCFINHFSVHLIPETLARTNLQNVAVGDKVNIEFDQQTMTIVETIERMKL